MYVLLYSLRCLTWKDPSPLVRGVERSLVRKTSTIFTMSVEAHHYVSTGLLIDPVNGPRSAMFRNSFLAIDGAGGQC